MRLEIESDLSTMSKVEKDIDHNNVDAQQDAARLLNDGILAAQSGDRVTARTNLLRVTELDPRNESAWLWLSSISEYPEELLVFLDNVLDINPDNQKALQWRSATKSLLSKTFVQRGIDSYSDGQTPSAKQCFEQALIHDDQNETAWLWLASLAEDNDSKIDYLEKVLLISPSNETAQAAYAKAKSDSVSALFNEARVAAIAGQKAEATALLDKIVETTPDSEDAWMLKAHLSDSFENKIDAFKHVLKTNPENAVAKASLDSLEAIMNTAAPQQAQPETAEVTETQFNEAVAEVEAETEIVEEVHKDANQSTFVTSFLLSNPSLGEAAYSEIHDTEDDAQDLAEMEEQTSSSFESDADPFEEVDESVDASADAAEETVEEFVEQPSYLSEESDDITEAPNAFFEEEQTVEEAPEAERVETPQAEAFDNSDDSLSDEVLFEPETENLDFAENSDPEVLEETVEAEPPTKEETVVEAAAHFFDSQEPAFGSTFTANEVLNGYSDSFVQPAEPSEVVAVQQVEEFVAEEPFHVEIPNDQFIESESFAEALNEEEEHLQVGTADLFDVAEPENDFIPKPFASLEEVDHNADLAADDPYKTVVFENNDPVPFTNPCPFCTEAVSTQSFVCQNCNCVLTLADIEMLLANQRAEKDMVRVSVEKLEDERRNRSLSNDELVTLGIGHLNLRNLHFGFNYLSQAAQADPNNIVLKGQVNEIGLRIEEIRQQEVIHESLPKGKTILVVDDSPTVRKLISTKLEKHGHVVVCADDGTDALSRLGEVVPDLVLLDITMPNLDGYQVCKQIRVNPLTQDVPVVMISGKDGFFDKVRGRMAGTTGYITKPFGPETLMKTVDLYLNNKEVEAVN